MNFSKLVIPVFSIAFLTACSGGGGGKTISIMASGKLTVDAQDTKNVTLESGTTHYEKQIYQPGSDKITITVKTPDGVKTFDADGDGHFLLNLQKDTLIGGLVKYGEANNTTRLTAADVDRMIDSTRQLLLGQNTTEENKTYWLPPFTMKKVSAKYDSKVVGPYNGIPGSVGEGVEVYKFSTNKDKRVTLENLINEAKK